MFYTRDECAMLSQSCLQWALSGQHFLPFQALLVPEKSSSVRWWLCLAKNNASDCCRWSEEAATRRSCCAWSVSVRGTTARRPWSWSWSWPGRGSRTSWRTPCTRSWPRACASTAAPRAGAAPSTKSEFSSYIWNSKPFISVSLLIPREKALGGSCVCHARGEGVAMSCSPGSVPACPVCTAVPTELPGRGFVPSESEAEHSQLASSSLCLGGI